MMMEDGEDVQKDGRTSLKKKPAGLSKLLLGRTRTRTRTRSSGEPSETKPVENHDETSARCSAAAVQSKDELTSRGRHKKSRNRSRFWRRFSSVVLCISKKKVRKSLENPSEAGLQKPEDVSLRGREEKFKMKNILRRFRTSDVQRAQGQNRGDRSPKSFQKKLQKFFIRGGKRRDMEDMKVQEDMSSLNKDKQTDESLEAVMVTAEVNLLQMEGQAAEGPEPPTETPVEVLTNPGPDPVQTVDISQVPVEVLSLEDDEVFVDLQDLLRSEVHPEEKTTPASQTLNPSINGPSIRIEVCPPQDFIQEEEEEEEEEYWDTCPSENHLHLLFGSELQLLQTARSLVRTAMRAAVDQLRREQNHDQGLTPELQIQRRVEPGGPLPVSSLLNVRF